MANRYWVGGVGTWNTTSTANWSDTSGGAGGFSAPIVGDDVFFDNNSGTGIVTVDPVGILICSSVTYNSNTLTKLYISVSYPYEFNVQGTFTLTQGTLHVSNPNGYIQFYNFISSNTNVRSVILDRGISISGSSGTVWDTTDVTNLTTTLTGTPYISVTLGSIATTISPPNVNAGTTNVFNFTIDGGSCALTINSGFFNVFRLAPSNNLFTGSWDPGSNNYTVYSNFLIGTGFTQGLGTHTFNFINTGTVSRTIACLKQAYNVNFSTTSTGGWSVTNLFASTGTTTLNSGPLSVSPGLSYICGRFVSSNTNTRSISIGTSTGNASEIELLENSGTVWDVPNLTGFSDNSYGYVNYKGYGGTISHGNIAGGNISNSMSFKFSNATTNPITITSGSHIYDLLFTGNCTWTTGTAIYNIYTNITLSSGMTFNATGSTFKLFNIANVTSAGKTFDGFEIATSWPDAVTLIDDLTLSGTLTLTSGSFDVNGKNITCDRFSSSNSSTRRITFSGGAGTIITITGFGTVWNTATSTSLTIFNPQNATINLTYSGASPVTFTAGSSSTQVTPKINVTAGTYSFVTTTSRYIGGLNFTGFSGTWAPATIFLSGSLILSSTMTFTRGTSTIQFQSPISAVASTITSAGNTFYRINVAGSFGLSENLILTNLLTHTNGTLALINFQITADSFSGSSSNTRTISFGTGNITLTGSGTVWNATTTTGLTCTGSRTVNLTYAGASAVTINAGQTGGSESNALDFNVTAGTYSITIGVTMAHIRALNFTGFTGTWAPSAGSGYTFYGSVTLVSGMGYTAGSIVWIFANTSGSTAFLTSAGKQIYQITMSGVGGNLFLADNVNLAFKLLLTEGTFNANNYNVITPTFDSSTGSTRSLVMGSGTWMIQSTTPWAVSSAGGLTISPDTSTISVNVLTPSTTITFAGDGYTYNNISMDAPSYVGQILYFTGANTFNTISSTKTVAWTVWLPSSTITTVGNWAANGTAGNLISINSSSGGVQATLAKSGGGVMGVNYASIKDSDATPASTWYALNSTDVSNNTGWTFGSVPPTPTVSYNGFFLLI